MDLASLQRAFQRHVLTGDPDISQCVAGTKSASVQQRLQVYSDAYRLRLIDAMAHNYPRLQELLGGEQFAHLASEYLQANPSQTSSVRWLGDRLSSFLQTRESTALFADLARWEWAVATAFDAQDVAAIDSHALASIAPDAWPGLRFRFHPSMQLLETRSNAAAVFKALTEGSSVPELCIESSQRWLLWRQDFTPRYRSLPDDELAALRTARGRGTFEQICESLAGFHEQDEVPLRAITLLKTWLGEELLTAAEIASGDRTTNCD